MGKIYCLGNIISYEAPEWEEKAGKCDDKCKQYRVKCGAICGEGTCLSTLIGHTCKHVIVNENERKKFLDLSYAEYYDKQNLDKLELTSSNAKYCEQENESVKFYRDLSEMVSENCASGFVSKHRNIALQGGGEYKKCQVILQKERKICSFYLEENLYVEDYCLFSLLKKLCIRDKDGKYDFCTEKLTGLYIENIVFAGGKQFVESKELGIAERIEDCLRNRKGDNGKEELWDCIFRFYLDSMYVPIIEKLGKVAYTRFKAEERRYILRAIKARYAFNRRKHNLLLEEVPQAYMVDIDGQELYSRNDKLKFLAEFIESARLKVKEREENLKIILNRKVRDEITRFTIEQTEAYIAIEWFEYYLMYWYREQYSVNLEDKVSFKNVVDADKELIEQCETLKDWLDFFELLTTTEYLEEK